jgi:hypothetical protein
MRLQLSVLLLAALATAGCGAHPQSLTESQAATVQNDVRGFMQTIAHDVTQNGPAAWRANFADTPAFFMVVDGRMAFTDNAAARAAIDDLVRHMKSIRLQWGAVRVDPLTPNFAVVAAPWDEVQVSTEGKTVEENGFFTAIAEYRGGRWQFRDAHWSSVPQSPSVP